MMRILLIAILLLNPCSFIFGGEYTNTFSLRLKAVGESEKKDPVEAFNSAIEYATENAESLGEVRISGASAAYDGELDSLWVKKEANLQVIDLQVRNYRYLMFSEYFSLYSPQRHGPDSLLTEVEIDITMEYLDVPRFMNDYEKTELGAALRSMAFPGWGQFYNNQYTTGFLYSVAFWSFYGYFSYLKALKPDSMEANNAALNFHLPAMIFWAFNLSESTASRYLGKQGLETLRKAYRLDPEMKFQPRREKGLKFDFYLFQVPLF
jgi:hypothetical protein